MNCPKAKYHSYKVLVSRPDGQKEACRYCGQVSIYRFKNWKMNPKDDYLMDHIRDFAQPFGKTKNIFLELWGQKALYEAWKVATYEHRRKKSSERRKEDFHSELKPLLVDRKYFT
jgi:hypothetical protein